MTNKYIYIKLMSNFFSDCIDLDEYFEKWDGITAPAIKTGYSKDGKDLNELYQPYDGISDKVPILEYSVNDVDLSDIFLRNPNFNGINIICYSKTLYQEDLDNYFWPVKLISTSSLLTITITFGENLTFNTDQEYFIICSDNIIIEGNYKDITINNVSGYPGLFQNGNNNENGYTNIKINNLNMISQSSTLSNNNGWILQEYFGKGQNIPEELCFINNCTTDINCSSSSIWEGLVSGRYSNGIICNYCSSFGAISGGGIFGRFTTYCIANNCYSEGQIGNDIVNFGSGGIYASNCNSTNRAYNCYSTGNIYYSNGYGSGGICGEQNDVVLYNSYSLGTIGSNTGNNSTPCGGIFGNNSHGMAINCYSAGIIQNNSVGIGNNINIINCYIANGNWSDIEANSKLIETPIEINQFGNIWTNYNLSSNSPYYLTSNLNKYYTQNINSIYFIQKESTTLIYNDINNISLNNNYKLKIGDIYYESIARINGYVEFTFIPDNNQYFNLSIYDNSNNLITENVIIRSINNIINTTIIITNDVLNDFDWPIIIEGGTNTNTIDITFESDITLNNKLNFFIINSEYININGNNQIITIDNVFEYPGLLNNNLSFTNITIKNINMSSLGSSTISESNAWICQQNFNYENEQSIFINILNCSTDNNCSSLYSKNGLICGSYSKYIICNNCYSYGRISGGGIFGSFITSSQAINCFSTGQIGGDNFNFGSGGIYSYSCDNTNSATNCYSTGDIYYSNGWGSGGICGESNNIFISNCYSTGIIGYNSGNSSRPCGGIFGTNTSSGSAHNCYSLGLIQNSSVGIGASNESNCYIANNNWNNTNARIDTSGNPVLINTPIYDTNGNLINPNGTIWSDTDSSNINDNWLFTFLGYTPYSNELITTFSQSIKPGDSSVSALNINDYIYSIVSINNELPNLYSEITISETTGIINTATNINLGTYIIKVKQFSNNKYTMTDFELTII